MAVFLCTRCASIALAAPSTVCSLGVWKWYCSSSSCCPAQLMLLLPGCRLTCRVCPVLVTDALALGSYLFRGAAGSVRTAAEGATASGCVQRVWDSSFHAPEFGGRAGATLCLLEAQVDGRLLCAAAAGARPA